MTTRLLRPGALHREPAHGVGLGFLPGLSLARGRLHELCGPSRHALALWIAHATTGTVIWIAPAHADARFCPAGVLPFIEPGRLLLVAGKRPVDQLWAMEEALRAGVAGLVVTELAEAPALTPIRRLHLAAAEGAEQARGLGRPAAPGLVLLPGDGGAAGVESRWHMTPRHRGGENLWRLERRRARTAPPAAWWLAGTPAAPELRGCHEEMTVIAAPKA